jgi:hypothetical protein
MDEVKENAKSLRETQDIIKQTSIVKTAQNQQLLDILSSLVSRNVPAQPPNSQQEKERISIIEENVNSLKQEVQKIQGDISQILNLLTKKD